MFHGLYAGRPSVLKFWLTSWLFDRLLIECLMVATVAATGSQLAATGDATGRRFVTVIFQRFRNMSSFLSLLLCYSHPLPLSASVFQAFIWLWNMWKMLDDVIYINCSIDCEQNVLCDLFDCSTEWHILNLPVHFTEKNRWKALEAQRPIKWLMTSPVYN